MKKNVLTILVIILIIFAIVFLVAKNKGNTEDNSLEYIMNKGKLVIGLDDSFPPIGFRNEDNEIVGFDIDLAREVCKRMGIELICQPISWAAKEQELNSKNIDCVWNGMSITEERAKVMNITESYMTNKIVFVTTGNSSIKSYEELSGKIVGVQLGTTADEAIESNNEAKRFKELVTYNDSITAFMDLDAGQVDAVLVDELFVEYYIKEKKKDYKKYEIGIEEEYGIGFRKKDEKLKNAIEEKIKEIKEDGTMTELSMKWFGEDVYK